MKNLFLAIIAVTSISTNTWASPIDDILTEALKLVNKQQSINDIETQAIIEKSSASQTVKECLLSPDFDMGQKIMSYAVTVSVSADAAAHYNRVATDTNVNLSQVTYEAASLAKDLAQAQHLKSEISTWCE